MGLSTTAVALSVLLASVTPADRKVNITVRQASVRNVLQQLAAFADVDLVLAEDVAGKVTITFRDVPWTEAFTMVVHSQGLDYVRYGDVVFVDRLERMTELARAKLARKRATQAAAPLATRVIRLSYARATDLAPLVKSLLSPRGQVVVDRRTNTLIVTDIAAALDTVVKRVSP